MGAWKDAYETGHKIGSDKSKTASEAFKELTNVMKRKIAVSRRLKKAREESGLTQKQVADKLELKKTTLSGYENGKSEPSMETLVQLANLYGVSLDYLMCRTDTRIEFDEEEYKAIDTDRQQLRERLDSIEKELSDIRKGVK